MKITGNMTLGEALQEIETRAREFREGAMLPNGRNLKLERRVKLEIEFEREKDAYELEFEITWKRKRRGLLRRLLRL